MRLSASHSANHIVARATSGQVLDISYDPAINALVFVEAGWSADVRGAAAAPSVHRQKLPTPKRRRALSPVRRNG